jgi:transcriptional regulator GlxA family with amidase domain
MPTNTQSLPIRVAFLAFGGMQMIDLAGPSQVFSTANEEGADGRYQVTVVSREGGAVHAAGGLVIMTSPLPDDVLFDTVIVVGGPGVQQERGQEETLAWLKKQAQHARRVCSVCTGAFLLAQAGLLEGRTAVTHWRACAALATDFPGIVVDPDPIYVRDGPVYTSAGVTAGIDVSLALVEEDIGAACAHAVARRLVVYMRRPGGQAQFSDVMQIQARSAGPYAELIEALGQEPARAWTVEDMAEACHQSVRTFYRKFTDSMGESPSSLLERLRVDYAVTLLKSTAISIKDVSRKSGFSSEQSMRRAFLRKQGVAPASLKSRP